MSTASVARSKETNEMSPSSGTISTSPSRSRSTSATRLETVRMLLSWLKTLKKLESSLPSCVKRARDVDGDDMNRAELLGDADRQVGGRAAVDELAAVELDRRERSRDRHAGAHRGGQRARADHHRLAGGDVHRHRPVRDRQAVEVALPGGLHLQRSQQQLEALAAQHPRRDVRLEPLEAQLGRDHLRPVVLACGRNDLSRRRTPSENTEFQSTDLSSASISSGDQPAA